MKEVILSYQCYMGWSDGEIQAKKMILMLAGMYNVYIINSNH